jgi:hypothetical protein
MAMWLMTRGVLKVVNATSVTMLEVAFTTSKPHLPQGTCSDWWAALGLLLSVDCHIEYHLRPV